MSADTARFEQRTFSGFNPRHRERAHFATRDADPVIPPLEFPRPQIEDAFRRSMGPQEPAPPVAVPADAVPPPEVKPVRWHQRPWVKKVRFVAGVFLIGVGVVWIAFPGIAYVVAAGALAVGAPQVAVASATLGTASFLIPSPLIFALALVVGGEELKPVVTTITDFAKRKAKQFGNWFWGRAEALAS